MIYLNGSVYEGGWENDKKNLKGRMYEKTTGDIYSGDYTDGKRNGRGRLYNAELKEIYDGEWSNDKRQGEGHIINLKGEIRFAEFRADAIEGKVTHQRTLSKLETEKIFKAMIEWNEQFIGIAEK